MENLLFGIVGAEGVICIVCLIAIAMQKKKCNTIYDKIHDIQINFEVCEKSCKDMEQKNRELEARQIAAFDAAELKRLDFQKKNTEAFENFTMTLKQQMFTHEAMLLSEHGEWCLEHQGEKKFFKPGKIEKVISSQNSEESSFKYTEDCVICTVTQAGQVKSELTFSLGGTPKFGKIFESGKIIKSFSYNELGQVVTSATEGEA